jgi:hypothetical protein
LQASILKCSAWGPLLSTKSRQRENKLVKNRKVCRSSYSYLIIKPTEHVWAQVQHTTKDNVIFKTAVFERLTHEGCKDRKLEQLHQILLGNRNCNIESGKHSREPSATIIQLMNKLTTTMMMMELTSKLNYLSKRSLLFGNKNLQ